MHRLTVAISLQAWKDRAVGPVLAVETNAGKHLIAYAGTATQVHDRVVQSMPGGFLREMSPFEALVLRWRNFSHFI